MRLGQLCCSTRAMFRWCTRVSIIGLMLALQINLGCVAVSYGWQGDLSEIGCQTSDVSVVDADFAKLAARGIAIIFARWE